MNDLLYGDEHLVDEDYIPVDPDWYEEGDC